ncbi:MAG: hypothetical protein KF742_01175 [Cryobacterium sp.]|nr:hypothetical protein [Cryobacterium sp.]MBX3090700.1 hypothetical protein [Cryobacterium sp.]
MIADGIEVSDGRWWEALPLRYEQVGKTFSLTQRDMVIQDVLKSHVPVAFRSEESGEEISVEQLAERIAEASAEFDRSRGAELDRRRREGWEHLERAFARRDAEEVIRGGVWSGFKVGTAIAWMWNFIDFEPKFGALQAAKAILSSMDDLKVGTIPEHGPDLFDWPKRARELEMEGWTPSKYRRQKDEQGIPVYRLSDQNL